MISEHDIAAFREHDDALSRAEERLKRGTTGHRHIMPNEEISLIKAGVFWRAWCRALGVEVLALREELERRGLEAMEASADPCRK